MAACTKNDLMRAIAAAGFPLAQSEVLVETVISLLKDTLASGEDVLISGFGKFCVKSKRERRGRNPATGESVMLKPRKIVTFKWSGQLRQKLNL
jgi:integration host factor subunit alpha